MRLWAITDFVKKFETLAKSFTFLKHGFGCTVVVIVAEAVGRRVRRRSPPESRKATEVRLITSIKKTQGRH